MEKKTRREKRKQCTAVTVVKARRTCSGNANEKFLLSSSEVCRSSQLVSAVHKLPNHYLGSSWRGVSATSLFCLWRPRARRALGQIVSEMMFKADDEVDTVPLPLLLQLIIEFGACRCGEMTLNFVVALAKSKLTAAGFGCIMISGVWFELIA